MKSGIDLSHINAAIRPQDDLYRYMNGSWIENSEIPADRPIHGAFHVLRDMSEERTREIIEQADPSQGSEAAQIAALYQSFMDEALIEKLGMTPIQAELDLVDSVTDKKSFFEVLGKLQRRGVGGWFGYWVTTDDGDATQNIMYFYQAGLGLPDEAYYREDIHQKARDAYLPHITKMFELAKQSNPAELAKQVFDLETKIASHHWDVVADRDAVKTYNKLTRAQLVELGPEIEWDDWQAAYQMPDVALAQLVVRQPSYVTGISDLVKNFDAAAWKAWLKFRVISSAASLLSSEFVNENFKFYGTTLSGIPELRARWKRGVGAVESVLGEAVGKLYVEKYFPPAAKSRMLELVNNLIEAYRVDIQALEWMSPETKVKALEKLDKFTPKIGYPDKWRDYSALEIKNDDLVGNMRRAAAFNIDFHLSKIGKPVDRSEWFMTPQTVNAYYNPGMNEIVFPAAILQSPFFDLDADDAVNYGGIGAVIGHEIGHGFDDQGSKYDGDGNLNNWWTDFDRAEFEKRANKLISQYDALEPTEAPGNKVNGALTIGENIGDLGGLTIAHKAYEISLAGKEAPVIDGLTGYQRLFLGWAQVWRTKTRTEEVIKRLATDPHSPPEFRCNAVVRNLTEFYDAFGVTEADELWLAEEDRVRIW